jgi:hypothetical protein
MVDTQDAGGPAPVKTAGGKPTGKAGEKVVPTPEPVKARKGTEVVTSEPAPGEAYRRPSFGLSEGTRADLEQYGEARDPFTGEELTEADLPSAKSGQKPASTQK